MANKRTVTLAALAQQALDQYRADMATGEPVFPQWALDLQQVLEERQQMVTALQKIAAADMGEGGCYYTNRENIITARRTLDNAGIPR